MQLAGSANDPRPAIRGAHGKLRAATRMPGRHLGRFPDELHTQGFRRSLRQIDGMAPVGRYSGTLPALRRPVAGEHAGQHPRLSGQRVVQLGDFLRARSGADVGKWSWVSGAADRYLAAFEQGQIVLAA